MNRILIISSLLTAAALLLTWSSQEKPHLKVSDSKQQAVEIKVQSNQEVPASQELVEVRRMEHEEVKKDFNQVHILSEKVFLNDEEKALMKESLLAKDTLQEIRAVMQNAASLEPRNFRLRLKRIDALYEGLKFADAQVREQYGQLAAEILSQNPGAEVRADKKKLAEFFGDRVEIALSVSKLDAGTFESIRAQASGMKSETSRYFRKAAEMAQIYEVAL